MLHIHLNLKDNYVLGNFLSHSSNWHGYNKDNKQELIMGLLATMAHNMPKGDFPFTSVKILSLMDGRYTTINIIDSKYSINGEVVKVEELPSFEGEWAALYLDMLKHYINLAKDVEMCVRAGRML